MEDHLGVLAPHSAEGDAAGLAQMAARPDLTYDDVVALEGRLADEDAQDPVVLRALLGLASRRHAYIASKRVADRMLALERFATDEDCHDVRLHGLDCAVHGSDYAHTEAWMAALAVNVKHMFTLEVAQRTYRTLLALGPSRDGFRVLRRCHRCFAEADDFRAALTWELLRTAPEALELASRVKVLSLGEGCYPWLQLNRAGLRTDVSAPHWHSPFNMMANTLASVVRMLETDFSLFEEREQYALAKMLNGAPVAFHRGYRVTFNHECGPPFLDDDLAPLITRYREWSADFRAAAHTGRRLFVAITFRPAPFAELERALAQFVGEEDHAYRLLILDTQPAAATFTPARRTTHYLHLPLPRPGFSWVDDGDSPEGIAFDLAVRAHVMQVMADLGRKA